MPKKLIIVDSEFERITANGRNAWGTVQACLRDLSASIRNGNLDKDYLPWKILVYSAGKDYIDLNIHTRITGYKVGVVFDKIGGD